MFCSFCGKPADGNYCEHCGHKLRDSELKELIKPDVKPLEVVDGTPVYDADALLDEEDQWAHEVNYKTLVRHPDVRDLLVMANNRAHAGMTGEEFLKKFDSAIPGLSIATSIVQPLYSSWGVKTGKTVSQRFDRPVGKTIVSILCALAEGSSKIRNVQQLPSGCRIEASIPSDIWSFEGILYIHVERQGTGTLVEAATKIPGQWFDFGKSQRVLNQLLTNIRNAA
jgi:hypothetical protein